MGIKFKGGYIVEMWKWDKSQAKYKILLFKPKDKYIIKLREVKLKIGGKSNFLSHSTLKILSICAIFNGIILKKGILCHFFSV